MKLYAWQRNMAAVHSKIVAILTARPLCQAIKKGYDFQAQLAFILPSALISHINL